MVSILRPSVLLALVSVVYLVTEGEAICCPWVMTTVRGVHFIDDFMSKQIKEMRRLFR